MYSAPGTYVADHYCLTLKQKTARPEPDQARRSIKNSVVSAYLCDSVSCLASCFAARAYQKIRRFANTLFQFRKVHENLVVAQPARYGITRIFFCVLRSASPSGTQSTASHPRLLAATRTPSSRKAHRKNSWKIFALQSAPYSIRVSLYRSGAGSVSVGCRLLLRERRCCDIAQTPHRVFKFVAIMRQSATNGKRRNRSARAKKTDPAGSVFQRGHMAGLFSPSSAHHRSGIR